MTLDDDDPFIDPTESIGSGVRFRCAGDPDGDHDTVPVFVRCPYCRRFVAAGYECETCGTEDVDPPLRLPGHGQGVCIGSQSCGGGCSA